MDYKNMVHCYYFCISLINITEVTELIFKIKKNLLQHCSSNP